MTKRLLALAIAFLIPFQAFAASANPEQLMVMVDEYIKEVKATPKDVDPAFADAQAAYFAEGMAIETRALLPEEFNIFMFAVMSRYINKPDERDALFKYMKFVRGWISADLENTAKLEYGAAHFMNPANYSWYTWAIIGAGVVIGRKVFNGPMRNTRFVQAMENVQLKAATWKAPYRIGFRAATHPLAIVGYAGAGLGYLEYQLEKSKLHRLDPMVFMNVVQTQIAFHLAYQALPLEDRFNSLMEDEARLRSEFTVLNKDITTLVDQATLLIDQYGRLDNISPCEPEFIKAVKKLPLQKDKYFRDIFVDEANAKGGQCGQVALTLLIIQGGKMREALKASYENLVPPPADVNKDSEKK